VSHYGRTDDSQREILLRGVTPPHTLGGTELKAGEYQVELVDQKAVITKGKVRAESPVTVASADEKFSRTTVVFSDSNGKSKIHEIRLGGTTTKLVFAE